MNKPRNNVVRYMNSVNKNAVHKNKRKEHILDDEYFLDEEMKSEDDLKNKEDEGNE